MRIVIAWLLLLCLLPCANGEAEPAYLYMVNVGKGDAIIVCAGGRSYLIDCGKAAAWESVENALRRLEIEALDGVFLTHTDKDHAGGLKKLVKSGIEVRHWYASAFYTDEYDKHPMIKALKKQDAQIAFLKAGDSVDGIFTVLAPFEKSLNEDNNSLVMMLDWAGVRVLLSGDMEQGEEQALLKSGVSLACDIFKVPNHADDDVCLHLDLGALGARVALVSTDPYEKPVTPDPALLKRLEEAGMEVYRTDFTEHGIRVDFDSNSIRVTEE